MTVVRPSNMKRLATDLAEADEPSAPPIALHANDDAGKAAHEVAMFVTGFDFLLLAAASPRLDREKRAEALAKVFAVWPGARGGPRGCGAERGERRPGPPRAAAGFRRGEGRLMASRYTHDHAGWTEERLAILKAGWEAGDSHGVIAKRLGDVTRNACIGKASRMGWNFHAQPSAPAPRPPKPVKRDPFQNAGLAFGTRNHKPPVPLPTRKGELTPTATILDLNGRACRWPIGDPLEPGFGYCGRCKDLEATYCPAHARVAYAPTPGKRTAAQRAGDEKRHHTMLARNVRRAG